MDGMPPGVVRVQIPPEERLASLAEPVCPLTIRSLHILYVDALGPLVALEH